LPLLMFLLEFSFRNRADGIMELQGNGLCWAQGEGDSILTHAPLLQAQLSVAAKETVSCCGLHKHTASSVGRLLTIRRK
jgi:hypothetical protein